MLWRTIILLSLFSLWAFAAVVYVCVQSTGSKKSFYEQHSVTENVEQQLEYLQTMITVNDVKCKDTIERLRIQNTETRKKLDVQRDIVNDLEKRNRQLIEKLSTIESGSPRKRELDHRLAPHIKPDVLRTLNIHQPSEFEVIPYMSFTRNRLYLLEQGMINRPEAAPIGDKKKELEEILETSLSILNSKNDKKPYNEWDLLQGYSRIDRTRGTQYELYFFSKGKKSSFEHIQLFRPFAPLQNVQLQSYDKKGEWINLILPLSGRVDSFITFMDMFTEECIKKDKLVFLTIVYFGSEKKEEVKSILEEVTSKYHFTSYKFIERVDKFSRGVGLLTGAEAWDGGNTLLFFCDVDIHFKDGFLDRCRLNSVPGSKVYYPIVFSMYNPSIVYGEKEEIPSYDNLFVINRDSGFWRTFGFGMTCMYRSDFLFMRGFDTNIHGWGYEDVKLYRKFAKSNFDVVRSPDAGVFHIWHEKICDPYLQPTQYNMCLASKALGEASQAQLGMLAFKELREENERLNLKTNTENVLAKSPKKIAEPEDVHNDYNQLLKLNEQFDNY